MTPSELLSAVEEIAKTITGPAAADVDIQGRFPVESIDALKRAGMMGAAIPVELGGIGCSLSELGQMCMILGRKCTSTSMIVAMHHIQVASLVNHGLESDEMVAYVRSVASECRLISSGTSEMGPSGDMRQSVCFVSPNEKGFTIEKQCTAVSYGQMAQDILFQARKGEDSNSGDQATILAVEGTYDLKQVGTWDTLGMRGTSSPGGVLKVAGAPWQILDAPFSTVAAITQVPWAHSLWSHCWLGAATEAVDKASKVVRRKGRSQPGQVPPVAYELSKLSGKLQVMRSLVKTFTDEYTSIASSSDHSNLKSLGFALRENNLKINTSEIAVEIVTEAMRIVGIGAYKNDGEASLGRQLRDVCSGSLMISNQRIHETNASMLLVHKSV